MTDDVAQKFDDAYQATKGEVAELANKVDDALSPGMITPEGITIKPPKVDNTKGSNVLEMRGDTASMFVRVMGKPEREWSMPGEDMVVLERRISHNFQFHARSRSVIATQRCNTIKSSYRCK